MRKRDPQRKNRDANVVVRVTSEEKRGLLDKAARSGTTLSTLVRGAVVRALHEAPPSNLVAG